MDTHTHLIQSPNLSDSVFVKVNGTLVNKYKHLIQISVRELYNNIVLTVSQDVFWCNK